MPIYDYQCDLCGERKGDVYHGMHDTPLIACVCGSAMAKAITLPHTDLKAFHTPIDMYSVALEDQDEIRELKKKCPDADISDDPRDEMYGVPIARTRKAKMQILAATGYQELNSERVRT